jgi:hypothetical protein
VTFGVLVTALIAFVGLAFLITTGSASYLAGEWGESWTRDVIAVASKRGFVWGAVSNVEFDQFDIDHLLVAPRGVTVIETKMHARRLSSDRKRHDIQQCRAAASKAESLLRSVHVGRPMTVSPVLVVWGTGGDELPIAGVRSEGVTVLPGRGLERWLALQGAGRLAQDHAEDLLASLGEFMASRRPKQVTRG